jgi:hypothetical protein
MQGDHEMTTEAVKAITARDAQTLRDRLLNEIARAGTLVTETDSRGARASIETIAQQYPLFEREAIASNVRHAEGVVQGLATAIGEAREAVEAARQVGQQAEDEIAIARGRQLRTLRDVRKVEADERTAHEARTILELLSEPLTTAERLLVPTTESVAVLAQAALALTRRLDVERGIATLSRLREALAALQAKSASDNELAAILRRMERRIGRALPVPTVAWTPSEALHMPSLTGPSCDATTA